jgi:proline iminopeptidase
MSCPGELIAIDDTQLWVVERGPAGGYPLFVLHGGPGLDHHEFADYLDPLTDDDVRLLLVDQRAQGHSTPCDPSTWTLERMAQDVIMLALAMGLQRYGVLGHSFGAFVALQNAIDYPGMAAQTILSSGVGSMRWLEEIDAQLVSFEPVELREQVRRSWERESELTTVEEADALWRDQLPFQFADPLDPRITEYLERSADTVYVPDVLRTFAVEGYGGIEVEDRLDEVVQPVLVLAGRHDRTCVPAASEAIASGIPGAELAILESSGHMTFVEEPERYKALVGDFLKRTR